VNTFEEVEEEGREEEMEEGREETAIQKLKRKRSSSGALAAGGAQLGEAVAGGPLGGALTKELFIYDRLEEPAEDANILGFYQQHESLLPLMSKAARRILGVPCASSSVERTFSVASGTVTNLRVKIKPTVVEGMVIQKANGSRVDLKGIEEEAASEIYSSNSDSDTEEDEVKPAESKRRQKKADLNAKESKASADGQVQNKFEMEGTPPTPRMPRKRKLVKKKQKTKLQKLSPSVSPGTSNTCTITESPEVAGKVEITNYFKRTAGRGGAGPSAPGPSMVTPTGRKGGRVEKAFLDDIDYDEDESEFEEKSDVGEEDSSDESSGDDMT
jgi:hypothetical protein